MCMDRERNRSALLRSERWGKKKEVPLCEESVDLERERERENKGEPLMLGDRKGKKKGVEGSMDMDYNTVCLTQRRFWNFTKQCLVIFIFFISISSLSFFFLLKYPFI